MEAAGSATVQTEERSPAGPGHWQPAGLARSLLASGATKAAGPCQRTCPAGLSPRVSFQSLRRTASLFEHMHVSVSVCASECAETCLHVRARTRGCVCVHTRVTPSEGRTNASCTALCCSSCVPAPQGATPVSSSTSNPTSKEQHEPPMG